MYKNLSKLFILTVVAINLVATSPALAQETTKQRTTGTYLPAQAASMKEERIIDVEQKNTVELKDGTVKVDLPEQFYDRNVRVVVRRVSWENNSAVPALKIDNERFVGNDIFEVTAIEEATGVPVFDFEQPVTIQFRYFDTDVENIEESGLKVRYFNRVDRVWEEIAERNLDMDSNTITIEIDHFSLFAITGSTIVEETKDSDGGLNWLVIALIVLVGVTILGVGGWLAYNYYVQSKYVYAPDDDVMGGSQAGGPMVEEYPKDDTKESAMTPPPPPAMTDSTAPPTGAKEDNDQKSAKPKEKDDEKDDKNPPPDDEIWVKF